MTPMATPTPTAELRAWRPVMFNPPAWVHMPRLGKVIVPGRHMCRASIIADGITYLNENEIARAIINDIGFGHFDPNGNLVWVSPRR